MVNNLIFILVWIFNLKCLDASNGPQEKKRKLLFRPFLLIIGLYLIHDFEIVYIDILKKVTCNTRLVVFTYTVLKLYRIEVTSIIDRVTKNENLPQKIKKRTELEQQGIWKSEYKLNIFFVSISALIDIE